MNQPADIGEADDHKSGQQHPLLTDPARLQKITVNMNITIQRVLFGGAADPATERVLPGGESARDVLQEALVSLLSSPQAESWEALSVRIARARAIDALRRATAGRRRRGAAREEPDDITVVAFDAVLDEHTGTPTGSWWDDPEQAYVHHAQVAVLHPLIRALPEPQRSIVVAVVFDRRSRAEVGREYGLSGQRVGQIAAHTLRELLREVGSNPAFPSDTHDMEES